MRLPTITTNYGGSLHFANDENCFLVDVEKMEIHPQDHHLKWAKPSISSLQKQMRRVYENKEESLIKGKKARETIRNYSEEKVAKLIKKRLDKIKNKLGI